MKQDENLLLLMQTIEHFGVEIRHEPCESNGGLVRMREKRVLFINSALGTEGQKEVCLGALRRLDMSGVHVPPRVRALMGEDDWD